eukprot:gene5417-3903_t
MKRQLDFKERKKRKEVIASVGHLLRDAPLWLLREVHPRTPLYLNCVPCVGNMIIKEARERQGAKKKMK